MIPALLLNEFDLIAARYEAIGALYRLAVARGMDDTAAKEMAGRSYEDRTSELARLAQRRPSAMDKIAVPAFYARRYGVR